MEKINDLIMPPLCLLPDEQKDPQLALTRLFDETDFEYLRVHLWHFLKAAAAEDYFRLLGQPSLVCELVGHFELIIDMFYLLYNNKNNNAKNSEVVIADVDRAEADRHYMLNLYKIHKDYNGNIRRLGKEEIENLYLVVNSFFAFYSRNEWRKELKQWQYYALTNESLCVVYDGKNMIIVYEHLEKLLEAAYLLYEIGDMEHDLKEDEADDYFSAKKRSRGTPVLLTDTEQNDPFTYICGYFGGTTLSEHTKELSEWIQAVFGEYVWDLRDPGELVYFYEETVKLVEAAFELYNQKESGVEWIEGAASFGRPKKEPSGYHIYPHYLDKKEAGDPWLVLEELCEHRLGNYHERLLNWLYQALMVTSDLGSKDDMYFYNLLQKLAEALYILSVKVSLAATETEHEPSINQI